MELRDRIGRRLRLHDLHVFMAVVQAGSMNKAAMLLNTIRPAELVNSMTSGLV